MTAVEAAFFDLDKTIVARSSPLALGRSFFREGLISRSLLLKSLYAQLMFQLMGADEDKMERMRREAARLTEGWDRERVRQVVTEVLEEVISPLIYAEALERMHDHRAAGRLVCIVSSSPEEIVEPLANMLRVDRFIATRPRIIDGRYTGELDFYAYGSQKAQAMKELANDLDIDLGESFAYSDSITDLPMLEAVGHPVAINPDKGAATSRDRARLDDRIIPEPGDAQRETAAGTRSGSDCPKRDRGGSGRGRHSNGRLVAGAAKRQEGFVIHSRRGGRILLSALCVAVMLATTLIGSPGLLAAPDQVDLEKARDRLLELERDFELVVEKYNRVHEHLEEIRTEMASKELVVRAIERRMNTKVGAAVDLAREMYKAGATGLVVESMLSADSLAELETRVQYLKTSEAAQVKVFETLEVDRITLERELKELDEARAKALATEQQLTALRSEIDTKLEEQRDEIAEIRAAIERAERRAAAREAAQEAARQAAAARALGLIGFEPADVKPAPAPNERSQIAVDAALSQVGKPYRWGAAGPDSYDCSGLTMWAWAHAGVALPHGSSGQYAATPRVARSDWAPGDLLFFGNPIHHVAMYIGNGQMVEAPYTGTQVRVTSASRSDYVGAGRPGV